MFSAFHKGIKIVQSVKKAKSIVKDLPQAKAAGENLYGQVSLAVEDRKLTDQELEQVGEAFKVFMREGRDVVQAFWPVVDWAWKKIR